jgi:hypothetical protein
MWRQAGQGIGTARYFGVFGKLPWPGVDDVMSTSGVYQRRKAGPDV